MGVYNYNAKNTSIVVDGVNITGLGEDMVSIEKEEDYFTVSVGAQGDVVKSAINNDLATVTIYVQATSPQKKFLMGLAKKTKPFPIWFINKAMGERAGGSLANLLSHPELARGAEVEDMEFVFQVFDFKTTIN